MALILNIETSSPKCSVCLANDGEIIALKETTEEQNHSSVLAPFIEELVKKAGVQIKDMSAVAISAGPGSYTGLRIGTSTAKGLCFALDIPLIALDSLVVLTTGYADKYKPKSDELLCPMIDARRMEVYYSLFSSDNHCLIPSTNIILDTSFFSAYANKAIHCFGSGAGKLKKLDLRIEKLKKCDFSTSSTYMAKLSFKALEERKYADIAYFEPNYIKPFYFGETKLP